MKYTKDPVLYGGAMLLIDRLIAGPYSPAKGPEAKLLLALVTWAEGYERTHYPIKPSTKRQAAAFRKGQKNAP